MNLSQSGPIDPATDFWWPAEKEVRSNSDPVGCPPAAVAQQRRTKNLGKDAYARRPLYGRTHGTEE
jgi:hypothetical protein